MCVPAEFDDHILTVRFLKVFDVSQREQKIRSTIYHNELIAGRYVINNVDPTAVN